MFASCTSITSIDLSGFTNLMDASEMFAWCYNLTSVYTICTLKKADISTLSIFEDCTSLDEESKKAIEEFLDEVENR